ncbi:urea ABC transporter permease subunit UrtB [Ectothiorhodospiraceae bacterium WFHF3C12]|nr:urea ABC transporter permease subunit UrtB [Ectothiorhodospiraceae bacterium WFHF3C12]
MDVAEQIADSGHPRAAAVLSALKDGNLYVHQSDGRIVIQQDRQGPVVDATSGKPIAEAGSLEKIRVNILMRRQMGPAIARLRLASPDPEERLAAAKAMYGELAPDDVAMIRARLEKEDNDRVRDALRVAASLALLDSGEEAQQLEAVEVLGESLQNEARNALRQAAGEEDNPAAVQEAAATALETVESRVAFYDRLEQVFFGLSLGSVLLLAAIGLAITFGVMGVINMAHGEFLMLGAYTTFVVQQLMPNHIGLSLFVALPAAFLVAGAFGVALERGVIRFLYGRPLETLLATFGVSLFLQQLVRTVFSPLNRSVTTPEWMSGSIVINPVLSLTMNRLVIIAFALLVFIGLLLIMNRTTLGLKVRAVAQNRSMARAVGVRGEWVDAMTFGLGAGIAGLGGVALSQITNVGPNLGQAYIVDSFLVVVFGGVGNLFGTLTAALSLGVLNKFLEPTTGAVLAKVLVLVFIILFIQKRPQGLFPQRGRAASEG